MLRVITSILVVLAVAVGALAQPAGKIVFTSVREGKGDVYIINTDTTGLKNLTDDDAYDDQPALSPDGTEVVFVSDRDGNRDIYLMDLAKESVVRLTYTDDSESDPVFTNNAEGIIYTLTTAKGRDVYLLDLVSGESRPLCDEDEDEYMANQGPGGRITYVKSFDFNEEIMLLDSTGYKRLTDSPGSDFKPTFTADGKEIFFVTGREGDHDLYKMYADGTGETPFLNTDFTEGRAAPSPDGKYVAVPNDSTGTLNIFIYDIDGNLVSQLTNDAYDNYEPHWSK